MSVAAHLAHATTRRARLRLPSAKGDDAFFHRVLQELQQCPAVTRVSVNAATASVLVCHLGDLDAVARHAEARGLFEVRDRLPAVGAESGRAVGAGSAPRPRTLDGLRRLVVSTDEQLRLQSRGAVDLRTIAFGALLGGSAYQLARGKFLPVGGTMLLQACALLFGGTVRSDE